MASRAKTGYNRAMLNTIIHGQPTDRPTLLIAHGLFGSARNWGVIAKRLADARQVVAVDMRNHGHSPHLDGNSYAELAEDLANVVAEHGGPIDIVGHSMGGKAAMVFALAQPKLLRRLIVADIAPVAYGHSQIHVANAMLGVDLESVERRSDAADQLSGVEDELKPFLLQSLDVGEKKWRLNLPVLHREMEAIIGFPPVSGQFSGDTLFLTGANSDYVRRAHRAEITALFPKAKFVAIKGAGHWLHAEKPREFETAVRAFLDR